MNLQELTYELEPEAAAMPTAADRQHVSPSVIEFQNIELRTKIANLETRCLKAEAENDVLNSQLDKAIRRNEHFQAVVSHYEKVLARLGKTTPYIEAAIG